MNEELKGKVCLVTGAGSIRGMGRAICRRFGKYGAKVVAVDREMAPKSVWPGEENWRGMEVVMEEVKAAGGEGIAVVGDISKSKDVDSIVKQAMDKYGRIDIFVQCVGIRGPMATPIVELDDATWQRQLDINLTGPFMLAKAITKVMIPDPKGKKMVFIASLAGSRGYVGSAGYCASKHGVIGLAKTLALELAEYKINVNIISPGAFDTNLRDESVAARAKAAGITVAEMLENQKKNPPPAGGGPKIPLGRLGTPEDIADLVLFLVTDQSSYITGQEVRIDGGAE